MVAKKVLEVMQGQAEDGDSMAERALRDYEEEFGNVADLRPPEGWCLVMTATFYYLGCIIKSDHEYYLMAPGAWIIYETGPLDKFFDEGVAKMAEKIGGKHTVYVRVRKGPTISVVSWPHGNKLKVSS